MERKAQAHQEQALAKSDGHRGFAYFMEMGTGKSFTAIRDFARSYYRKEVDALCVIAPNGSYTNWAKEHVPDNMPEDIKHRVFVFSSYMTSADVARFIKIWDKFDGVTILVMNVEGLSIKDSDAQRVLKKFLTRYKVFGVIDESDTIKADGAKRTKFLLKQRNAFTVRRILTGTPVTQGPLDTWSQMRWVDDNVFPFSTFTAFRSYFAEFVRIGPPNRQFPKLVGYRNLDELTRHIEKKAFLIRKDECLDLPEKIYTKAYFEMPQMQRKIYDDMMEKCYASLAGNDVSAVNGLAALTKLLQIASGHVKDDTGTVRDISSARIETFNAVVDQIPHDKKVLCWGNFTRDIDLMCEALERSYGPESFVRFDGKVSEQDRAEASELFKKVGGPRFFVANESVGGRAHNFQHASYAIYYNNSFKLMERMQSEDRIHRIGQTEKCQYVDIVATDTVDEKVLAALMTKQDLATSVLSWRDFIRTGASQVPAP